MTIIVIAVAIVMVSLVNRARKRMHYWTLRTRRNGRRWEVNTAIAMWIIAIGLIVYMARNPGA